MSKQEIQKKKRLCAGKDYKKVVMELCSRLPPTNCQVRQLATFCSCNVICSNLNKPDFDRLLVIMEIIDAERFEYVMNNPSPILYIMEVGYILPVDNTRLTTFLGDEEELIQFGFKYLQEVDFITSTSLNMHLYQSKIQKGSLTQLQALTLPSPVVNHASVIEDLMSHLEENKRKIKTHEMENHVLKNIITELETKLAVQEELKKNEEKINCHKSKTGLTGGNSDFKLDGAKCKMLTDGETLNNTSVVKERSADTSACKGFSQPQHENKPFDCSEQGSKKFGNIPISILCNTEYNSEVDENSTDTIKGHCEATKFNSLKEETGNDIPFAQPNTLGHQYSLRNKEPVDLTGSQQINREVTPKSQDTESSISSAMPSRKGQHQMPSRQQLHQNAHLLEKWGLLRFFQPTITDRTESIGTTSKDSNAMMRDLMQPQSIVQQKTMQDKAGVEINQDCTQMCFNTKTKSMQQAVHKEFVQPYNGHNSRLKPHQDVCKAVTNTCQDSQTYGNGSEISAMTPMHGGSTVPQSADLFLSDQPICQPNKTCDSKRSVSPISFHESHFGNENEGKSTSLHGISSQRGQEPTKEPPSSFSEKNTMAILPTNKGKMPSVCTVYRHEAEMGIPRDILQGVADELGDTWKKVLRYLGLSDAEIDNIESREKNLDEKAYQGLQVWKCKNGRNATVEVLCTALDKAGRRDICDKFHPQEDI